MEDFETRRLRAFGGSLAAFSGLRRGLSRLGVWSDSETWLLVSHVLSLWVEGRASQS